MRSLAAVALVVVAIAACGRGPIGSTPASAAPSAAAPASPVATTASLATRAEVARVLGARSIGVDDARAPFQPPESARLQAAPRLVVQAFLPKDPLTGQIVIYELPSSGEASTAGADMAAWIASGAGRVNFTPDARFVLRQSASTLVFYTWSPDSLVDPAAAAGVADALSTIGTGVAIPS